MFHPEEKRRCPPEIYHLKPAKLKKFDMKENIPPMEILQNMEYQKHANDICVRRTPKKNQIEKQAPRTPVTPNTNIKLLTSLASTLEYAHYNNTPKSIRIKRSPSCQDPELEVNDLDSGTPDTSRKAKSLALICSRFLSMFPLHPQAKIRLSLDEVGLKLGVERRRLYDIINVFESISVVNKCAKNQYEWHGTTDLMNALHHIKTSAAKDNLLDKLKFVLEEDDFICSCIVEDVQRFQRKMESYNYPSHWQKCDPYEYDFRKEKSLASVSQKFLMLLLVSPTNSISLNVAAKVLNGFNRAEKTVQIKTQIRRLYDIANVLSSIGLINKESADSNLRRPSFKYIGPDLEDVDETSSFLPSVTHTPKSKRSLVRHSSFQDICSVAAKEHQRLCMEETPNSAPPFSRNLISRQDIANKTSFESLNLEIGGYNGNVLNTCNGKDISKVSIGQKNKNPSTASLSGSQAKQTKLLLVPNKYQQVTQSNTGVLNSKVQTYWLMPLATMNQQASASNSILKNSEAKEIDPKSKTVELSDEQRNLILKSLNISLSPGQVAEIKLNGSSEMKSCVKSQHTNLLKITENEVPPQSVDLSSSSLAYVHNSTIPVLDLSKAIFPLFDTEVKSLKKFDSFSSNNSSRYPSPLSIPSGYATPIPNESMEFIFPTSSQVDSVLNKIECAEDTSEPNKQDSTELLPNSNSLTIFKTFGKEDISGTIETKPIIISTSDECHSNDGMNTEVSEILKGQTLGDSYAKSKSFLIDEKTVLSPIKKAEVSQITVSYPLVMPIILKRSSIVKNSVKKIASNQFPSNSSPKID